MNISLTRRGEILQMLRLIYDAVPTSFKFVIEEVVKELGRVL